MELVKAAEKDVSRIMVMIDQAKAFLKNNGVDQWQNGYPDEPCIQRDIASGKGHLCKENGEAIGYLCIDFDGEPAYNDLNGKWLSEGDYVVVHRLTLSDAVKGKGYASRVFQAVEDIAREAGVHSFKVDTDNDNLIMKHLLAKNGFTYCGTICFDNSEKIAYEKSI